MNDLVSVIVPVYNVEEYVDKCMISICEQTYVNIQVVSNVMNGLKRITESRWFIKLTEDFQMPEIMDWI